MENHVHNWEVIMSVKTAPWDEFMGYRGEIPEKELSWTERTLTHKVFCTICNEVMTIK